LDNKYVRNMSEKTELWHVTSPFKVGHECGYYDMGLFSKIELAVGAANTLLYWLVGLKAGQAKWEERADRCQFLIFKGLFPEEDIIIGVVPRIVNSRPKDLDAAEHTIST
jgi:hypothetical protein